MAGEILYNGGATDLQVVVNGENGPERAFKVLPFKKEDVTILHDGGATDPEILLNTANGPERALKVYAYGSGAHTYSDTVYGVSPLALPNAKANSLSSVKLFGGTQQEYKIVVPDGYTQLEYIQSPNANAYSLKLNRQATTSSKTELKINPQMISESAIMCQAWALNGYFLMFYENNIRWHCATAVDVPCSLNTDYTIKTENGKLTVNGTEYTCTPSTSIEIPSGTTYTGVKLFSGVTDAPQYPRGKFKLYYLKWYEGDTLEMNLVPAKRNSDSVVGLYDTIGNTFLSSEVSGVNFVAGPAVVPTPDAPVDIVSNNGVLKARHQSGLPLGYKLLDHVTFDGTQEVDTGLYIHLNDEIRSKFEGNVTGTFVYGASTSNPRVTCYLISSGNQRWGNIAVSDTGITANVLNTVIHNKTAFTVNGASKNYSEGTGFTTNNTLTIGNCNGNISTAKFSGNFYYMEIDEAGVLAAKMLPAQNSNGVVGFYDVVRNIFLAPTTGTLAAGPTVSDPIEIYTDGTVETIEDTIGNTATAEMLLKISSDYQDQQEIIDGTVTRKVGVKVFDGTERWSVASTNVLQADVFPVGSTQPAVGGYCTALSYTDSSTLSGMPENSFRLGSQVYPRRLYVKSSAYATDATTWTNYLKAQYAAGAPVIVVYPLATATTETVTGQTLNVQQGDNTLTIIQASMSGLELEATYTRTA